MAGYGNEMRRAMAMTWTTPGNGLRVVTARNAQERVEV